MAKKKRPIDSRRESAGSMTIGTAGDKSPITGMLKFGGMLLIVKEKGVYQIQLADEFDPERTNPAIPNAQKLILKYGSKSEFVCRTILLSDQLLKVGFLQKNIRRDQILSHVFSLSQKLAMMNEIVREHKKQERRAIKQIEKSIAKSKSDDAAFDLPQIPNLSENFATFFVQAKFVLQCLLDIAQEVYGSRLKRTWFTSLIKLARERYGEDDEFYQFLRDNNPFCEVIRKVRNCVEHPKPNERVDIHNTTLNAKGAVMLPHYYVIHPDFPNEPAAVMETFNDVFRSLMFFSEAFIIYIVGKHIEPVAKLPFSIGIIRLPKDRRRYRYLEYSLGATDGKNFIMAG